VSPAKLVEPIETLLGLRTPLSPGNHELDMAQIPNVWGNSDVEEAAHMSLGTLCCELCKNG